MRTSNLTEFARAGTVPAQEFPAVSDDLLEALDRAFPDGFVRVEGDLGSLRSDAVSFFVARQQGRREVIELLALEQTKQRLARKKGNN